MRVNGDDGLSLPARVTIVDADGALAALLALPGSTQAVRRGVADAASDPVRVGVLPGMYRIRATRGPEYAMHEATVSVRAGEARDVVLRLTREVATAGWPPTPTSTRWR